MSFWYVDSSAAGSNNGTSLANAWTALSSVSTNMVAGDTCFVYSGTYDVRFTIPESGTSASARMRFVGVDDGGGLPIVRGINIAGFDYIEICNFEITQPTASYNYAAIAMSGATGCLIQNCYIHDTYGEAISCGFLSNNTYNIVRGNRLSNISGTGAGLNGTCIKMDGDYNLIEYNTIDTSLDRVILFGTGNVVRNNAYRATDTALYPSSSPYPFHTDGLQSYEGNSPLVQTLYEANYDTDNRDTIGPTLDPVEQNGHGMILQNAGAEDWNWLITRFNIWIRQAEAVSITRDLDVVCFYNNAAFGCGIDHTGTTHNAITYEGANDNYDYRNNTFCFNPKYLDAGGLITTSNRPTNFSSGANHAYNTGDQSVLPASASPANLAQDDPGFVDGTGVIGHDNYNLTVGSILRDAAGSITLANGADTASVTLIVDDAKRIFDGWGVLDGYNALGGDFITIGAGAEVQVSSIDYGTNTITLASARTWADNATVYVRGTTDVGPLPYGNATPSGIISNVGTAWTCTVSGTARSVLWTDENGIVQAPVYTAPYTITGTGPYTAQVAALYANNTPLIIATTDGGASHRFSTSGQVTFSGRVVA